MFVCRAIYNVCVHLVDVVGAIEVGVVDEALPAHCGTGLLEIDAHDDYQLRINVYRMITNCVYMYT